MHLSLIDIVVIVAYAVFALSISHLLQKLSRRSAENGDHRNGKSAVRWWAIGTSLIAANISAEQIIGMSGSAYALGIAIAAYEWLAAFALLVIGKYFLPVFLRNQISTMPQFLQLRYGTKTQVTLALFWLCLYTFVILTAIMWLGATAVHAVTGLSRLMSIVLLGLVAGNYALYVGLKSTHFTDVVQVAMLVLGGLVMVVFSLDRIAATTGAGGSMTGLLIGLQTLTAKLPEHFHMILTPDNPYYKYLPGLAALFGAMWVLHFAYWGFNPFIVQHTLAARSTREVQHGIVLAAFLKLLIPVIVVLPGIAAAFLLPKMSRPDEAYPELLTLLPPGMLGFVFVALVAAIVASMGSTLSAIANLFTGDILKALHSSANPRLLAITGRFAAIVALLAAMAASVPLLDHVDQAFQFIQEYIGYCTPGIVVVFVLGIFWRRASETGALIAAGGSVAASTLYAVFLPSMPFMHRMGYVFLICAGLAVAGSLLVKPKAQAATIQVSGIDYSTGAAYNIASAVIVSALATLYWYLW